MKQYMDQKNSKSIESPHSKILQMHFKIRKDHINQFKRCRRQQINQIQITNLNLQQTQHLKYTQKIHSITQAGFQHLPLDSQLFRITNYIMMDNHNQQQQMRRNINKCYLIDKFYEESHKLGKEEKMNQNMKSIITILSIIRDKELFNDKITETDEVFKCIIQNDIVQMILEIADYIEGHILFCYDSFVEKSISKVMNWTIQAIIPNVVSLGMLKLIHQYLQNTYSCIDNFDDKGYIDDTITIEIINNYFNQILEIIESHHYPNITQHIQTILSSISLASQIYNKLGYLLDKLFIHFIILIGWNIQNNSYGDLIIQSVGLKLQIRILNMIESMVINNPNICQQISKQTIIDGYLGLMSFSPFVRSECQVIIAIFKHKNVLLNCFYLYEIQNKISDMLMFSNE